MEKKKYSVSWFEIIIICLMLIWIGGVTLTIYLNHFEEGYIFYHNRTKVIKVDTVDINITLSVYQPDTSQCDDSPFITANNSNIIEGSYYYWCAVSRDLMYTHLNFGDIIHVKRGDTTYKFKVMDLMSPRWLKKIDILIPNGNWKTVYQKNNRLYKLFNSREQSKIIHIERE